MKNLLVFISRAKELTPECQVLAKIQIDNHFRLGLPKEDLILVTNFPYEYNGVKAILTKDEHYCGVRPRSIKTSIVADLIDEGIIVPGEIYWNHDFDAFQINPITDAELGLDDVDMGLTDYGWRPRLCMGSYFIKSSAYNLFFATKPIIFSNIEDEDAMQRILDQPGMESRWKRLNITYNLGMRHVAANVDRADKPIKVLHFHPRKRGLMDVFKPLMPDELIKIMNQNGYK